MLNQTHQFTVGWDVGGAHLKAALLDAQGSALEVVQVTCPLWQGLVKLEQAVSQIMVHLEKHLARPPLHHAVTMTGELADIFKDRSSGVIEIADLMSQRLPGKVSFYAGAAGFVPIADVAYHTTQIASANWLASAAFVARYHDGLFIDIGSTTADFVLLAQATPQPRGLNDATRMQYDELVYTGAVRTPLMAVSQRAPFAGEWVNVAAEYFATTADIYRLTGELDESADMTNTADGAGKTSEDSARRLARMVGADLGDATMFAWVELAHSFKQAQINQLQQAALRHFSRGLTAVDAPIIGAGVGSFLARAIALQLNRPYIEASSLIHATTQHAKQWAAHCLPAYAVAYLVIDSAN